MITINPPPAQSGSGVDQIARDAAAAASADQAAHATTAGAHAELFSALAGDKVTAGDLRGYHEACASALLSTGKLNVLYFGDSLISRSTDVIGAELLARFTYQFRCLDYTTGTGGVLTEYGSGGYALDGTAGKEYSYTEWPTGVLHHLPESGWVKTTSAMRGTVFTLYYKKGPLYGTLLVESSANGTDWTSEGTIDCSGAAATAVWTLAKTWTTAGYRLRVTAQTGVCRAIGFSSDRSGVGRILAGSIYRGGLSLADAATCPAAAVAPVLADLVPNLVFVHTDDTDTLYNTFLPILKTWLETANAKVSVVLIGNGPKVEGQGGDAASIAQCTALRQHAAANNWSFIDGMKILVSYSHLLTLGWHGDGLHLDAKAYSYLQTVVERSLSLLPFSARTWTGNISNYSATGSVVVRRIQLARDPVANGIAGIIDTDDGAGVLTRIRPTREFVITSADGATTHFAVSNNTAITKHQIPEGVRIGSQTGPALSSGDAAPTSGAWTAGSIRLNTAPSAGQPSYWQCTVAGSPGTWVAHNL